MQTLNLKMTDYLQKCVGVWLGVFVCSFCAAKMPVAISLH